MRIGFYINPIARLREGHQSGLPDPAMAAAIAESAGAHIVLAGWAAASGLLTERDVLMAREMVRGDLVIVAPLKEELGESILKFHPDGVVLVDGSWDGARPARPLLVEADSERIASVTSFYRSAGVPAALLIEPNPQAAKNAARLNTAGIVFDCSAYAAARNEKDASSAIDRIADSALAAGKFSLMAAGAHGLNAQNARPVAGVHYIEELYFGQSIAARAMMVGLDRAVRETVDSLAMRRQG